MLTVTSSRNNELKAIYRSFKDGDLHDDYSYNADEVDFIITQTFQYATTLLARLGFKQNIHFIGLDKENVVFRADVDILVDKMVIFKLIQDNISKTFSPIAAPLKLETKAEFEAYIETLNYYA